MPSCGCFAEPWHGSDRVGNHCFSRGATGPDTETSPELGLWPWAPVGSNRGLRAEAPECGTRNWRKAAFRGGNWLRKLHPVKGDPVMIISRCHFTTLPRWFCLNCDQPMFVWNRGHPTVKTFVHFLAACKFFTVRSPRVMLVYFGKSQPTSFLSAVGPDARLRLNFPARACCFQSGSPH